MRNINIKILLCFLLVTFSDGIAVVLCTKTRCNGKVAGAGKKSTIEFHTDSTFNAVDDMGMAVSGKYILEENGTIRFEIVHKGSAPEIVEGKLSERGDELTFSSADDKKVETYKRVK